MICYYCIILFYRCRNININSIHIARSHITILHVGIVCWNLQVSVNFNVSHMFLYFMFSVFMFVCVNKCLCLKTNVSDFSFNWWLWLIFTGVTMACCVSVKFVGLFQMTFIGLMTIADLWFILGKLSKPIVICENILGISYHI